MTKKWIKIQSVIFTISGFCLLSAHANGGAPTGPLPTPTYLPSYQAPPPPQTNTQFVLPQKYAWLKNFYVAGRFQYDFANIKDTKVVNPQPGLPTVAKDSFSNSTAAGGAAIGYQFRQSGVLNRVEIEYMYHGDISKTLNPLYQFSPVIQIKPVSMLDTKIKTQTLLAKIYYDINTNTLVMPYIQGGAGVAFNETDSFSSVNFPPPIISQPATLTSTDKTTNFAWDVGAGLRFVFNEYVSASVGYQYTDFGKLEWTTVPVFAGGPPFKIESKKFHANSVTAGLMLHA